MGKRRQSRRAVAGYLRPEDLYRWPDEIQARLGVGRLVYELIHQGGLEVRTFGRRRYVRGDQVIAAIEVCSSAPETDERAAGGPVAGSV
jgi:hypothetical protein